MARFRGRSSRPFGGATARPAANAGALAFLKRWAIPVIAGVTPVMLIVINVAVWINDHVHELALWVAIAAFLSGMMFNSWTALRIYQWVQRRWPTWSPVHERNQELILVLGMGVVTVISFLISLFLYFNLRDARGLPNATTLWYGVIQIAYPFAMKMYFDRDGARRGASLPSAPAGAGPQPSQPASGAPRAGGTPGGYPPPLPPS